MISGQFSPPDIINLMLECRAPVEAVGGFLRTTLPASAHADSPLSGLPVLVIPGFGTGDTSTWILRRYLAQKGCKVSGWGQGTNMGSSKKIQEALGQRLQKLYETHQKKVALVGWSLGGIYARELARKFPDWVCCVVSLASPFSGSPYGNRLFPLAMWFSGKQYTEADHQKFLLRQSPPPVPALALHSKTDGIVDWRCSQEMEAEHTANRAVCSSHFGFVFNPSVLQNIYQYLSDNVSMCD